MAARGHFVVTRESCVEDLMRGLACVYPSLTVDEKSRIVLYNQEEVCTNRTVGLLSGGGSGHEPFAAGFVGKGMLTGAVAGKIFTSPPPTTIFRAICNVAETSPGFVGKGMLTGAVAGKIFTSPPPTTIFRAICNVAETSPGGVLVLYNNYTGDSLNFGLAMEKAIMRGLKIKSVVIDDDCAIDSPQGAGKRGLCGCIFVFKIAGGLAELGRDLQSIYDECILIKQNIATFGVTLKPCSVPGLGPLFEIEEGFMELGVGVHGEAGAAKTKIAAADEIAYILVDKLCKTLDLKTGDSVCMIVNSLGCSSQLEVYLMAGLVHDQLQNRCLQVERQYTGTLMTSLDMSGIQISLLRLPCRSDTRRQLWLDTLDSPTNAYAWPVTSLSFHSHQKTRILAVDDSEASQCP